MEPILAPLHPAGQELTFLTALPVFNLSQSTQWMTWRFELLVLGEQRVVKAAREE
jgi:hypothetical protein